MKPEPGMLTKPEYLIKVWSPDGYTRISSKRSKVSSEVEIKSEQKGIEHSSRFKLGIDWELQFSFLFGWTDYHSSIPTM